MLVHRRQKGFSSSHFFLLILLNVNRRSLRASSGVDALASQASCPDLVMGPASSLWLLQQRKVFNHCRGSHGDSFVDNSCTSDWNRRRSWRKPTWIYNSGEIAEELDSFASSEYEIVCLLMFSDMGADPGDFALRPDWLGRTFSQAAFGC